MTETFIDSRRLRADADRLLLHTARRTGWWLTLLGGAALTGALAEVLLPAAIGRALDAMFASAHAAGSAHNAGSGQAWARWLAICAALVAAIVVSGAAAALATGTASATATAWLRRRLATTSSAAALGCCGASVPGTRQPHRRRHGRRRHRPGQHGHDGHRRHPPGRQRARARADRPLARGRLRRGLPVLAMVLRVLVRDSSDVSADYQRAQGAIAARLLDTLAGARTVAAAGTGAQERQRILAPLATLRSRGDASWRIQARAAAQGMIIVPVLQVIVLAVARVRLAQHRITPGELAAASQYAVLAVGFGASIGQLNQLGRARGGSRRAAGLAAQPLLTQPRAGDGADSLGEGPGRLRLRGVTVLRGGEAVFSGLDLTVPGGCAVAVVGRSGAGKSTLASLAGRLIDPDEGEITLDGVALRRLSSEALRDAIVYAFERPALFGETPFEAISFGAFQPSREQVLSAAKTAAPPRSSPACPAACKPRWMRRPCPAVRCSGWGWPARSPVPAAPGC